MWVSLSASLLSAGVCLRLVPVIGDDSFKHLLRWCSLDFSIVKTSPSVTGKNGYIFAKASENVWNRLFKNDQEFQNRQQNTKLNMRSI